MTDRLDRLPVPPASPGLSDPGALPPERGGVSAPTPTADRARDFEEHLNKASISVVERLVFAAEVDVAREIADRSPLIAPGQNTPV